MLKSLIRVPFLVFWKFNFSEKINIYPLASAKMHPDFQLQKSCKANDFLLLESLKTSARIILLFE